MTPTPKHKRVKLRVRKAGPLEFRLGPSDLADDRDALLRKAIAIIRRFETYDSPYIEDEFVDREFAQNRLPARGTAALEAKP